MAANPLKAQASSATNKPRIKEMPRVPDAAKGHNPVIRAAWDQYERDLDDWRKSLAFERPVVSEATPVVIGASTGGGSSGGGSSGGIAIPVTVSGAPLDASYLVLGLHDQLSSERVLLGTAAQIILTDNGAGADAVLSLAPEILHGLSPLTTRGDLMTHDGVDNIRLGIGATGQFLRSDGLDASWQQIDLVDVTGVLPIVHGGTGQITVIAAFDALSPLTTRGDLLTRDGTNNIRLPIAGTANQVLRSDGSDPAWGKVVLTTDVAGILPVANGGTAVGTLSDILGTPFEIAVTGGTGRVIGGNVTLGLPTDVDISGILTATVLVLATPLSPLYGGTGINIYAQGDTLYASSSTVLSKLPKDSTAAQSRYLSNTGTNNNPAWAQINLVNGVSGNLPTTNLDSGSGATPSTFWRGDGSWGTPAGTGAPTDAQYVTLVANGTLSQERVLTGTANRISITDTGSTVVLSTPQDMHTTAAPTFGSLTIGNNGSIILGSAGSLADSTGTMLLTAGVSIVGSLVISAPLVATSGGTGFASYAVGDLLYASTTTALARRADVAVGNALISGGVGVAPDWGKIGLATHVSGDLLFANLTPATAASKLLGRGSASGAGDFEEITLGTGLTMTGTTLSASVAATPGGSDTQVQFNDGGAFGGDAGLTYNKTTNVLSSGALTLPDDGPITFGSMGSIVASTFYEWLVLNGSLQLPSGEIYVTASANSTPLVGIVSIDGFSFNPNLELGGTWNTTGAPTAILFNIDDMASDSEAAFLDFQLNTVSNFRVRKDGLMTLRVPLPATSGGTGFAGYALGDLLYADTAETLSKLAAAATGKHLEARGIGEPPVWGDIVWTDEVDQGDIMYANAFNQVGGLGKSTDATRYLSNTGTDNAPEWAQVNLTNGVSGDLPFANLMPATAASKLLGRGSASGAGDFEEITIGSGLTMTGTTLSASGGGGTNALLDATAHTDTVAQAVTRGSLVYGNATPKWDELAIGAANRLLRSDGTDVSWAQVALATDVSGDLPFANLTQGSALSVIGVAGNATADVAAIAAASDHQVLRRSGTALAFGAVNLASSNAITGDLPFANLTQGSALSVLGVTGNATADFASIAAGSDHQVLRRSGTALTFGAVNLAQAAAVTGILGVANGGTGTSTAFTLGSVVFAGASGVYAQDNANFFWDDTNNRLGLGIAVPLQQLHLTGNIRFPASTSAVGVIYSGANRYIHNVGAFNFFAGVNAGSLTTSGTGYNTGVGDGALAAISTGNINTAVGALALAVCTIGVGNNAIGQNALGQCSSGTANNAMGQAALYGLTTGTYNCAVGPSAGRAITNGLNCTFIGRDCGFTDGTNATSSGLDMSCAIGAFAQVQSSNTMILGGTPSWAEVNVGISMLTATARLHLPAGQAAASKAPLKFTTGPLLTTPAAGAMEYLTPDLTFTPGSAVRQHLPQVSGAAVAGDLLYGSAASIYSRLAIGTANKVLRSNGTLPSWEYLPFKIGVATRAASQSISPGSNAVSWDTEVSDNDTMVATGTSTVTFTTAGYYFISAYCAVTGLTVGEALIAVLTAGGSSVGYAESTADSLGTAVLNVSGCGYFSAASTASLSMSHSHVSAISIVDARIMVVGLPGAAP